MVRRHTKRHRKSSRHKRSLHRRNKRRVKTRKSHHKKIHRGKKRTIRRRRRRRRRVQKGGMNAQYIRSKPAAFQGPASMTGEAAPGSNYYAKLQNPNLPDPTSTEMPHHVQKGGALIGPNTLYNIGLGGLQRGWWDVTNTAKNLYHQWNGNEAVSSASSMKQPIDHKVKIISYDPPNVSRIYDSGAKQAAQYSLQNQ
tara:strand:- start:117 stop:707 length:591 start_codon:yes stop_codon:yes gene_type:complete